jgi:hypothetical protein
MKPKKERLAMLEQLAHDTNVSKNDTTQDDTNDTTHDTNVSSQDVSENENVSCNDTNDTTQNDTNDTTHDTNVSSQDVSENENVSCNDTNDTTQNDTNDTTHDTNVSCHDTKSENVSSHDTNDTKSENVSSENVSKNENDTKNVSSENVSSQDVSSIVKIVNKEADNPSVNSGFKVNKESVLSGEQASGEPVTGEQGKKSDGKRKNAEAQQRAAEGVGHDKVFRRSRKTFTHAKASNTSGNSTSKRSGLSKYDPAYIVSVLELLGHREAGGVTEVRIFPPDRYMIINGRREYVGATISGYYDNYEKLVDDIAPFDGKANIYVTINPVIKDLLARANNRLRYSVKNTTPDKHILCDLWFPYDCDPIRPEDISATSEELKAAIKRRDEIAKFLSQWAQSLLGMSGNGGHGLIRLPGYPNTKSTRDAKERLTKYLHNRFTDFLKDDDGNFVLDDKGRKIPKDWGVSVDSTVSNISRIWKLYGTMAVKGDDVPDRPHRRSYLEIPSIVPSPVDLYAHINEIIPQQESRNYEPKNAKGKASNEKRKETKSDDDYPFLDVPAYLNAWGGEWRIKEKSDRTWYQFRICPLHKDFDGDEWECGICQDPYGKMGAKCMHDDDYTWQDFKEVLGDPKPYYLNGAAKSRDSFGTYKTKEGNSGTPDKASGKRTTSQDLELKAQIAAIRRRKRKKAFEIKQAVSELIIDDMLKKGRFYKTREKFCYYFDSEQKELYPIGDDELLGAHIGNTYGINPSEKEYDYLIKEMIQEALIRGELTEVHQFAFYDTLKNILYVYNHNNGIYRLDGEEIKLVDNGFESVLFLGDPLCEPFEYVDIGDQKFLDPLMVDRINFGNGDGVNLDQEEQRWLWWILIHTNFFETLLPTKPIVAFIGPRESGKSMAQRLLLKVLFGSKFNVTSITKEDDFDAAVTANYIVAFDNVDGRIDWLNDKLAHTATGKMIQKRKLYTTNQNIRFFPKCFLMLNARTPRFKREDVTDRLLLFRTEPIEEKRSEAEMIDEVMGKRNEILSEIFNVLHIIVRELADEEPNFTTAFRMADWAKLAWQIAKVPGHGETLLELLEKISTAQSEFLLEDDPIFLCLDAWLGKPENVGREVTSSTLFNDFQLIAQEEGISFTYKNTKSFGIRLRSLIDDLREFFNVGAEKCRNKWIYVFQPKG